MGKIIKQTWRGCGYLPHVGHHPGTFIVFVLLVCGGVAGGWVGLSAMSTFVLPIYLWGAFERAKLSDHLEGQ